MELIGNKERRKSTNFRLSQETETITNLEVIPLRITLNEFAKATYQQGELRVSSTGARCSKTEQSTAVAPQYVHFVPPQ